MTFPTNAKGGWIVPAGTALSCTAFPQHSEFAAGCTFDSYCTFDSDCKFAYGCKFDSGCKFAAYCTLSDKSLRIGDSCSFDKSAKIGNTFVQKLVCLSNVDGSGRQVIIVKDENSTTIIAGCFTGNLEQFVAKAGAEGKKTYVAVVTSICTTL